MLIACIPLNPSHNLSLLASSLHGICLHRADEFNLAFLAGPSKSYLPYLCIQVLSFNVQEHVQYLVLINLQPEMTPQFQLLRYSY